MLEKDFVGLQKNVFEKY